MSSIGTTGVEIARKMQVDVFHRHYLRITAAGSAALNAHAGAERRLAQGNDNALPDFGKALSQIGKALCQTNGSGGFAFTGRGRRNSRNQNQFAVGFILHSFNQIHGKLGFVTAIKFNILLADAEFFGNFGNRQHVCLLSNFNIR